MQLSMQFIDFNDAYRTISDEMKRHKSTRKNKKYETENEQKKNWDDNNNSSIVKRNNIPFYSLTTEILHKQTQLIYANRHSERTKEKAPLQSNHWQIYIGKTMQWCNLHARINWWENASISIRK